MGFKHFQEVKYSKTGDVEGTLEGRFEPKNRGGGLGRENDFAAKLPSTKCLVLQCFTKVTVPESLVLQCFAKVRCTKQWF
eukprot:2202385-Amphidinium_carterae.1